MKEHLVLINRLYETFPFESPAQKRGLGAYIQWLRGRGDLNQIGFGMALPFFILWSIQKDHESNDWWATAVGDQITMLQNSIQELNLSEKSAPLEG